MKSKEALDILRGCIAEFRVTGNSKITHDEVINAKYELDKLVERDTPKKPLNRTTSSGKITYKVCPICREMLVGDYYCSKCGQRLDWSEK